MCPGEYQGVLIACQLFWQHNGEEMQVTGAPLEPKGRSAGDPEVQARPPAAIVWDAFSTVRPTEGAVSRQRAKLGVPSTLSAEACLVGGGGMTKTRKAS